MWVINKDANLTAHPPAPNVRFGSEVDVQSALPPDFILVESNDIMSLK